MLQRVLNLKWRSLARLFAFTASLSSLFVYWLHPTLIERIDERSRDVVFALRDAPQPHKDVLVVTVDEKSAKMLGRWPWPRSLQGELFTALKEYDAKVIGLDIVYVSDSSPYDDEILKQSLALEGSSLIGGYFFRDQQTVQPNADSMKIFESSLIDKIKGQMGDTETIPAFPYVETSHHQFSSLMQGVGFFNYLPEWDGLIRYTPLVLAYQSNYYPSLALQSLSSWLGESPELVFAPEGLAEIRLGDKVIPVDRYGRLALNFYKNEFPIKEISAVDVLSGEIPPEELAGKLVFVGVTELGIADVRPTPVHASFPGVAIHATVASNVLQDFHLYSDSLTILIDVLLIALVPYLMVTVIARIRRPTLQFFTFMLMVAILWSVFYWLLVEKGLLISVSYPMLAVLLGYICYQTYYVLVSQKHTRFLRTAFANYVSPALVSKLIQDPDKLRLTGEKRNVSLLFSDIRGFTTLSESLEPEVLVSIINEYLGPMTDIIMERGGTLDKYIGDAIMAIYNAPMDEPDHADRSVQTAMDMLEALVKLNEYFESAYDIQLDIGIGINTGEAVVGNMGSQKRFDYTAMGDTVNLAARLESRTKAYGVRIIVSEDNVRHWKKTYPCRKLDLIQVKGKTEPVTIYEVMDKVNYPETEYLIKHFEQAMALYFQQKFTKAIKEFESILEIYPDDGPSKAFIERCKLYKTSKPGKDWNGIYIANEK